jgi:hypothetical protein
MTKALSLWASLTLGALGCSSCHEAQPGDADVDDADEDEDSIRPPDTGPDGDFDRAADSDVDVDEDARIDADADFDPDAEDHEIDADIDLPAPVPMDLEEKPRERDGMECGPGCRQVSFAESVWSERYDVSENYLIYQAGNLTHRWLIVVDLLTMREYQLLDCNIDFDCSTPSVFGITTVFSTSLFSSSREWTLWRYDIGDLERYPLVQRRMSERSRPMMDIDVSENSVAWYDSAIAMAGLYAMNLEGGEVTSLTDEHCVCYADSALHGRQVVYQGWQTGFRDIWVVDIDTLDERNLNESGAPQFDPAFDGRWVVWADGRNDPSADPVLMRVNPDLYGMELPDGPEEELCVHPAIQTYPDVQDGLVVWEDFRNSADPNDYEAFDANIDIYLLDLESRMELQVTSLPGKERRPRLQDRRLFFVAPDLIGQQSIFMVDLVEAGLVAP